MEGPGVDGLGVEGLGVEGLGVEGPGGGGKVKTLKPVWPWKEIMPRPIIKTKYAGEILSREKRIA